jgi:S-adenosylmethionine synthetase
MPDLTFDKLQTPVEYCPFEVVERKGIGHPDTLADGIAEILSLEYSKYCLKNFGVILHHSFDKIMFLGGAGRFGFGIGEMIKPWKLILNGRASTQFGDVKIDFVNEFVPVVKKYLKRVLPQADIEHWLEIVTFTHSTSKNPYWFSPRTIEDVPDAKTPYANDTSVAVGYWPLSPTEQLALSLDGYFYLADGKPRHDFVGQDIKVLCVRREKNIDITLCVPFFSRKIPDEQSYKLYIKKIQDDLLSVARHGTQGRFNINLSINTQDQRIKKATASQEIGHYFVIMGSALDSGEEGVVGRGNRSRGIISNIRPQSFEGIYGKNPVYHVGKVYNYLADRLAKAIATDLECECVVYITSRNGDPLHLPHYIHIETSKGVISRKEKDIIKSILEEREWAQQIIEDEVFLPVSGGGHGYRSPEINFL